MVLDKIKIVQGDITKQQVDAIVNAANSSLLGGGGVDGAIHRAAGPQLLAECRTLNGCAAGEAKITSGYHLPAKWAIHTVGPVWQGGDNAEEELLARCYRSCLTIAESYEIKTIAFPAISTGAYGFPVKRATPIAIGEVSQFLQSNDAIAQVIFVCFGADMYHCYAESVKEMAR